MRLSRRNTAHLSAVPRSTLSTTTEHSKQAHQSFACAEVLVPVEAANIKLGCIADPHSRISQQQNKKCGGVARVASAGAFAVRFKRSENPNYLFAGIVGVLRTLGAFSSVAGLSSIYSSSRRSA
jgi:hypothetical protein